MMDNRQAMLAERPITVPARDLEHSHIELINREQGGDGILLESNGTVRYRCQ